MADNERLRDLHQSGTLHRRLLTRVRIQSIVGAVLLLIALFDAIQDSLNILLYVIFGAVGFVLGVTIFSRIRRVVWDEEQEVISTGKIDAFGIFAIFLYGAFEIGVHNYIGAFTGAHMVTGYIFVTIGGTLLGRSVGMRRAIYRALEKQRASQAQATP